MKRCWCCRAPGNWQDASDTRHPGEISRCRGGEAQALYNDDMQVSECPAVGDGAPGREQTPTKRPDRLAFAGGRDASSHARRVSLTRSPWLRGVVKHRFKIPHHARHVLAGNTKSPFKGYACRQIPPGSGC